MKTNATEAEIIHLQKVLDAKNYVKSTEYITKEEATKRLKTALGEDFTEILGEENNPLLPFARCTFPRALGQQRQPGNY